MKQAALFCIFTLGWASNPQAQDTWTWQNPQPPALDMNASHFLNANTGWTVGNGGTILKTVNGGAAWLPQNSGLPSVNLLGVDFVNAETGWVVGGSGTILKTTDGGASWAALSSGTTYTLAGVDFLDANHGWAVGYNGTGNGIILNTTNGGTSWNSQTLANARLVAVRIFDFFVGYAVGQAGGVYKTVDGGLSWLQFSAGVAQDLNALHFLDADEVWVAGAAGVLLKTTNGGFSWTPSASGISQNLNAVHFLNASTGWIAGAGGTLLKTTNGGADWQPRAGGSANLHAVRFADANNGWAAGAAGTLLRTTNGGADWNGQPPGASQALADIHFPTSATGYAAGASGTLLKTSDGGTTWNVLASGTAQNLNSVFFSSAATGYTAGAGGTLLKTTNGGTDWLPLNPGAAENLNAVYFRTADTGWVVGNNGTIRATTNAGASWESRTSPSTSNNNLASIHFVNANTGWAVGGRTILKTTNGGAAWTSQGNPSQDLFAVHAMSETLVFAVRGTSLYRTTNGGSNWAAVSNFSGGTGNSAMRSLRFFDANLGVIAAGSGYVIKTTDGGASWTPRQITSGAVNLGAVAFSPGGAAHVAGAGGAILRLQPPAPANLSYPVNPAVYGVNVSVASNAPSVQGVVTQFSIDPPLPAGLSLNPLTGVISGTASAAQAASNHTVTASNASGTASTTLGITVLNPIATFSYPSRNLVLIRGASMTPAVPTVAGVVPFGPVTYAVVPNLPSGLSLNAGTGVISGAPANAQANAHYVVTARNGVTPFNRADTLRLMVEAPPSNLSYSTPIAVYSINTPIEDNTATVSAVTGTSLAFSIAPPLVAGLSLNPETGRISGTPTKASGAVTHTVTATGASGSTTGTVRISVLGPPSDLAYPNVVFGVNVPAAALGQPSVSGSVTRWSITPPPPAGLWLDSVTGKFSGNADEAIAGSVHTLTAENGYGSTAGTVNISVLNPIVLFSYPVKVFNLTHGAGMTPVAPIVAGTLPFTPVTYGASPSLPTGLSLNLASGALAGTPTASQLPTQHVITVRNGVPAFNMSDTLTIAVSGGVISVAPGRTAGGAPLLRVGGRSVALSPPGETRSVRVRITDLRGRGVLDRALEWPSGADADLLASRGTVPAAGVLLVRIQFRDANGSVLGDAQRRVSVLP